MSYWQSRKSCPILTKLINRKKDKIYCVALHWDKFTSIFRFKVVHRKWLEHLQLFLCMQTLTNQLLQFASGHSLYCLIWKTKKEIFSCSQIWRRIQQWKSAIAFAFLFQQLLTALAFHYSIGTKGQAWMLALIDVSHWHHSYFTFQFCYRQLIING